MNLNSRLGRACRWSGLVLVAILAAAGYVEGSDIYLRIEGVDGDVTVRGHGGGWIRAQSPAGSSKATYYTITLKKGQAAESLEKAFKANTRFPSATLLESSQSGAYLAIKLENVQITSYQLSSTSATAKVTFARAVPLATPTGPLEKPDRGGPVQLKAPGPLPDLLPLKGLTIATTFIAWGQTGVVKSDDAESKLAGRCRFRYRYDTMNQGKGPAGATTNRAHLDSENGPVLAEAPLPALAPGAQNTSSGHLSFPVGTWTVYVHVDDPKLVAETDEKNNLQRVRVRVTGECQ